MKKIIVLLFLLSCGLGAFAQVEGQPIEILNIKDGTRLYGYVEKQKGTSIYFHTYYAYRKLYSQNTNTETDRVPYANLPVSFLDKLNNNIIPTDLTDPNDDGVKLSSISITSGKSSPTVIDNGILYTSSKQKIENVILDKSNNSGTWYWDLNDAKYLDIVPLSDVASIEKKYDSSLSFGILDVITFISEKGSQQKITGHIIKQIPGKSVLIRTEDNKEREILNSDMRKQEISKIDDNLDAFYQSPFMDVIYLKNGKICYGIILEKNLSDSSVTLMTEEWRALDTYKLSEISALGKKPNELFEEQITKYTEIPLENLQKDESKYFLQGNQVEPCTTAIEIDEYDSKFYVIKADAFDERVKESIMFGIIRLTVPSDQSIDDFHIIKLKNGNNLGHKDYKLPKSDVEGEHTLMKTSQNMGFNEVINKINEDGAYIIINPKSNVYFILIAHIDNE